MLFKKDINWLINLGFSKKEIFSFAWKESEMESIKKGLNLAKKNGFDLVHFLHEDEEE